MQINNKVRYKFNCELYKFIRENEIMFFGWMYVYIRESVIFVMVKDRRKVIDSIQKILVKSKVNNFLMFELIYL